MLYTSLQAAMPSLVASTVPIADTAGPTMTHSKASLLQQQTSLQSYSSAPSAPLPANGPLPSQIPTLKPPTHNNSKSKREQLQRKNSQFATLPQKFDLQAAIQRSASESNGSSQQDASASSLAVPDNTLHNRRISTGTYDRLPTSTQQSVEHRAAQLQHLVSTAVQSAESTRRSSFALLQRLNGYSSSDKAPPTVSTINEEDSHVKSISHYAASPAEPQSPASHYALDPEDELEIERIIATQEEEGAGSDDDTMIDGVLSPRRFSLNENQPLSPSRALYVEASHNKENVEEPSIRPSQHSRANSHYSYAPQNPLSPSTASYRSQSMANSTRRYTSSNNPRITTSYLKRLYSELKRKDADLHLAADLGQKLVDENAGLEATVMELKVAIDTQTEEQAAMQHELMQLQQQLQAYEKEGSQWQTNGNDSAQPQPALEVIEHLLHSELPIDSVTGDLATDCNTLSRKLTTDRRYNQSVVNNLQEQCQTAQQEVQQLQHSLNQAQASVQQSQQLQLQLQASQQQVNTLQQQHAELKQEHQVELKQQLRQQQKRFAGDIDELRNDVQLRQQECMQSKQTIDRLNEQISQSATQYSQQLHDLQQQLQQSVDTVNRLNADLAAKPAVQDHSAKVLELQNVNADLQSQVQQRQRQMGDLSQQLKQAHQELQQVEDDAIAKHSSAQPAHIKPGSATELVPLTKPALSANDLASPRTMTNVNVMMNLMAQTKELLSTEAVMSGRPSALADAAIQESRRQSAKALLASPCAACSCCSHCTDHQVEVALSVSRDQSTDEPAIAHPPQSTRAIVPSTPAQPISNHIEFNLPRPVFAITAGEMEVLHNVYRIVRSQWQLAVSLLPSNSYSSPALWKADETSTNCTACKSSFTLLRRRHHCRLCGQLFCNYCSSSRIDIPKFRFTQQRCCHFCHDIAATTTASITHVM